MLLEIISWNGAFRVSMRGLFFRWGASFLSGGGGGCHWGASVLGGGGGFEKNCMGKPEKNHLIIKNNSSILKKQ